MPKQITDVKNKLLDAAEKILKTEGLPMSMNLYMYIRRQLEMKANDKL